MIELDYLMGEDSPSEQEMASLQEHELDEIEALIQDLELVPVAVEEPFQEHFRQKITMTGIGALLEECSYNYESFEDCFRLKLGMDDWFYYLDYSQLPLITFEAGFTYKAVDPDVALYRQAAAVVMDRTKMVKVTVSCGLIHLTLTARHEDLESFRSNLEWYLEEIGKTTRLLKETRDALLLEKYYGESRRKCS